MMRNVFLTLVLLNLGFAAWHFWIAKPAAKTLPEPAEREAPSLTDVDTPPPAARQSNAGTLSVTARKDLAEPARCVAVGPFREAAEAQAAAAMLSQRDFVFSERGGEADVPAGYWLVLEGEVAGKRADTTLAKLRANGVPDAYLITDATQAGNNRISLGLFHDMDRANRLFNDVRKLGFSPVIVDRMRRQNVYWIDISVPAAEHFDFLTILAPTAGAGVRQQACPSSQEVSAVVTP